MDQGRLVGSGIAVYATLFRPGPAVTATGIARQPSSALQRAFNGDAYYVDAIARRRELRQSLAERRRALTPPERIAAAQGLRRSLDQLPEYLTDQRVAGYWATQGELPLNLVIPPLFNRGQQFLLPIVRNGRRLSFAPWKPGEDVQPNRYGIPEPSVAGERVEPDQVELVLVPLLGFDRRGHRLGYGGGYYDRSFAFLKGQKRPTEPLLVGIGYAFQEVPRLDEADWDIALDFIATDRELIDCHVPGENSETDT